MIFWGLKTPRFKDSFMVEKRWKIWLIIVLLWSNDDFVVWPDCAGVCLLKARPLRLILAQQKIDIPRKCAGLSRNSPHSIPHQLGRRLNIWWDYVGCRNHGSWLWVVFYSACLPSPGTVSVFIGLAWGSISGRGWIFYLEGLVRIDQAPSFWEAFPPHLT